MVALLGMAKAEELDHARNVLFVHTGGSQALSAYPYVR